jgi:hypothetical protein
MATIALLVVLMLLLLLNVMKSNDALTWGIYGVFAIISVVLIILLVIKRLIPALRGDIALELNGEGIVDYVRNITINWADIKEINLQPGRSSSNIVVELQWESDYGQRISISLRWIKGKDAGIFETMRACFEAAA